MKLLIVSVMLITAIASHAQNLVGNGGDVIASEFNSIARLSVYFLKLKSLSTQNQDIVRAVELKIETTLVESVADALVLDGREVDAINYPSINHIKISRKRWEQVRLRNPSERAMIVLHEYIWIAGIDDSSYATSSRLVKEIAPQLDQNSVSTEKYQVALAEYYVELNLFRADILGMQSAGASDFAALCYAAGSLKSHTDRVTKLTQDNLFWFSQMQLPTVKENVAQLLSFSEQQVSSCRHQTPVNFANLLAAVVKTATAAKYLIMITQFPESEFQ